MIILTTTSDKIQVDLDSNITTNQLQCYASYNDTSTTGITPGRNVVITNNTTAVDLVGSPASSTQRVIGYMSVYNKDTTSEVVTINQYVSSTSYPLYKTTLLPGEKLEYQQNEGFKTIGTDGSIRIISNQSGPIVTDIVAYTILTGDVSTTLTGYTDMTGLSFPVKAGKKYYFNFTIIHTTPVTTTGTKFSINGPTASYIAFQSSYPSAAVGTVSYNFGLSSYDTPAASTTNSVTNAIAKIEGIVHISSDGTLIGRFGSETNGSAVTAKVGSVVFYHELN
jgi:hypothetical protein